MAVPAALDTRHFFSPVDGTDGLEAKPLNRSTASRFRGRPRTRSASDSQPTAPDFFDSGIRSDMLSKSAGVDPADRRCDRPAIGREKLSAAPKFYLYLYAVCVIRFAPANAHVPLAPDGVFMRRRGSRQGGWYHVGGCHDCFAATRVSKKCRTAWPPGTSADVYAFVGPEKPSLKSRGSGLTGRANPRPCRRMPALVRVAAHSCARFIHLVGP